MAGKPDDIDGAVERFYARVSKHSNGCWLWQGAKTYEGYGQFMWQRKNYSAHRFSYLIHTGEPVGVVRHTCHNKACVNPDHLIDGSQKENVHDSLPIRTHCKYGHPNIQPPCPECHRLAQLRYIERKV